MKTAIEVASIAKKIRLDTFKAISHAGSGHYGGCLSISEILAVLYFKILDIDVKNPKKDNRDLFVLSKGHGGPALYATLANRGFFPISELDNLDVPLSKFPKHIDRLKLDCIEVSSGALGQGLSISVGMAISLKQKGSKNFVYVLLGDGECNSGQIWEAAMAASKYSLDNLIAIVDYNKYQLDGEIEDIMPLGKLIAKFKSFGWETLKTDGHDVKKLISTINKAKKITNKPVIIIADTIKGKGVSFMENNYIWHAGAVSEEQLKKGIAELEGQLK